MNNIRNFVIIAHIDHGKSTLADRFLEITGTVESRKMKEQYLDQLDLERERGITIKMAPVRMSYILSPQAENSQPYILNLIDTPGHPDFSYEVSRALIAVEGAILLVDATQGIQAQTLANFHIAKRAGLKITGAVNKIDMNPPQLFQVMKELADLIGCSIEEIYKISAKTGEGVEELLKAVIRNTPPPKNLMPESTRALVFDSFYDDHKGIIASVRVFDGEIKGDNDMRLIATDTPFKIKEIGYFSPQLMPAKSLNTGEIGYVATGIKDPENVKIGDTITIGESQSANRKALALEGYQEPKPVVFVSFYPEESDNYDDLKRALQKLKLNDSALKFEPDFNDVLGRGFKGGFLGKLHFEITAERLEREFNMKTINSFPSVAYKIKKKNEWLVIENPKDLSGDFDEIQEPIVNLEVITPTIYLGGIFQLKEIFRINDIHAHNQGDRTLITAKMPLAELISDFDDKLKSVSNGFASFSYELVDYKKSDLQKLEILVAGDLVAGLIRVFPRKSIEHEARKMVEKLKKVLPRQQFSQAIQAVVGSKIIARETVPAFRKDVTGYLYGGDRTRKMKLWKKQKKGKKRLEKMGSVKISTDVFKKMIQ
ncbi:MAG: translation elongation factor 4 [Patescibacteria group bacterium]